jgi:hypothetical protein
MGSDELMKPKVYIETTIPSYLAARPSRDLIRAAHQQLTREWWETRRSGFDLFVSQIVVQEVSVGDPTAAAERLELLNDITTLEFSEDARLLGKELLQRIPLPKKAILDAYHIAIAVLSGMDYLLTWNCKHIANATLRKRIDALCHSYGYVPPLICTPEELLEP